MKNILMNTEMTKAILEGRKVQTRRVIDFPFDDDITAIIKNECDNAYSVYIKDGEFLTNAIPEYQIGETIWVREPAKVTRFDDILRQYDYQYIADGQNAYQVDIPKRFREVRATFHHVVKPYPNWVLDCQGIPNGCIKEMARIFLKITNVRVERLKDISYCYIMDEGCNIDISDCITYDGQDQEEAVSYSAYCWYRDLWNKTAPKGYKWEDNPYVFVYEFKRVEK